MGNVAQIAQAADADAARYIGFFVLICFLSALLFLTVTQWKNPTIRQLMLDQFPVIVILPATGLFAFLIVSIFQSTSGVIHFEVFGLKLEGAAGPILMWVICFLSIVLSVSVLWRR